MRIAFSSLACPGWTVEEWEKLWHPYLDDANLALPKAIAFVRRTLAGRMGEKG